MVSFAAGAAILAGAAPLPFALCTVFLFAGPHQWVELRYFLSRLPSKFGPVRGFFQVSFAGLVFLISSYILLAFLRQQEVLSGEALYFSYAAWHTLFMLWVVVLAYLRSRDNKRVRWLWILPAAFVFCALAWIGPCWSGLVLVYFHPIIGLWILDRELRRSRPSWVQPYRKCLLLVPVALLSLYFSLSSTPSLDTSEDLAWQATRIAGAGILNNISSHLLVSSHSFLEALHYGAWVLAIPIATGGWRKWLPERLPIVRSSPRLRCPVAVVFAASTFALLGLWLAFALNYSASIDIYFIAAVGHALAEFPFLLWLL